MEDGSGSGPALDEKLDPDFKGGKWSCVGPRTITMEAWRLKMEPWRVCRPIFADSQHFDDEQDPEKKLL